jgi:hypothetical protein
MQPERFEPIISAGERPQTYALDSATIGTGKHNTLLNIKELLPDLYTDMTLIKPMTRGKRGEGQ